MPGHGAAVVALSGEGPSVAASASRSLAVVRRLPPSLPAGTNPDVSDPPAPGKMAGKKGEPSRPHQAAGRRGRSRPVPTASCGRGAAPKGRIPENGARETPCVSRTIREGSSKEDGEGREKWQLRKRKNGGRCPFFLLVRPRLRPGVMRETRDRGVERDGSSSRRSEPRRPRRWPVGFCTSPPSSRPRHTQSRGGRFPGAGCQWQLKMSHLWQLKMSHST